MTAFEPYSKVMCPNCGQTVRVRRKFDHFIINKQIGEGGMSRVFESADQLLGRLGALKILNRHYSRDGARMAQFEREAQLTAAVTHPNVVKVYSVGRDQGNFYIAMELVGGGSLEQRIADKGHIEEREVLRVGLAVAEGLRAAYREGLIHRDVKPANILFTEDGTPKIVDFGLALFHERDVDDSGEIWATPHYVAPEKVIDDREDFRSDMFSLGATLFHALTGRPPHKANTNSLSELKLIKSRQVSLTGRVMKFSPRTCKLVDRLLALAPEQRFQSYDELVVAFRDAETFLGYAIRGTRTRRQKAAFIVIGGVAAALTVLAMLPRASDSKAKIVTTQAGSENLSDLGQTLASGAKGAAEVFRNAREKLVQGDYSEAGRMFNELVKSDLTKPYTRNLSRFNAAICAIVTGRRDAAVRYFQDISKDADEEIDVGGVEMKEFFRRFGRRMANGLGLDASRSETHPPYSTTNEEALAYLVHGLAQWHFGDPRVAADWIEAFNSCEPGKGFEWVSSYKNLTALYLGDFNASRALGVRPNEPYSSLEEARDDWKRTESIIVSLKTEGTLRRHLTARSHFALEEISRLKRELQARLVKRQSETRQRELAQLSELLSSLPALTHNYDFGRVVELLKETRFESPEVQGAVANKLYLWSRAQDFVDQLVLDVNAKGFTGSIARRSGAPLQGRLTKMDRNKATLTLPRGELIVPTGTIAPDTLVSMAQGFCAPIRDSTEYYRRQEMIAVFAKLQGLDHMANTVAAQLMEENRAFRQRWTLLEQSGS